MKFDLSSAVILDLTKHEQGMMTPALIINGKPALIKELIVQTMLMGSQGDLPPAKKQKYNLASLLIREDYPDLSAEDITCITDAVGLATAPMIYGQVCDFFNNSDNVVKS